MSNPIVNPLMAQAQQSLQNPAAQATPQQAAGGAGILQHPVVQAIIKAISSGTGAYGWTAMPPEERVQRTGLEQQKADTLARLAQTGAYQQGELAYRGQMADTAAQRADTMAEDVENKRQARETSNQIKQQQADLAEEKNKWQQDMAKGRLGAVKDRISNQAAQFEKTFQLRSKQVGLEAAKVELMQQATDIKKGFLDLAGTAIQQKGTAEGLDTIQKLQNIEYEHPILSHIFGLDDVKSRAAQAQSAGIPGTAPPAGAPTPGAPAPTVGAQPNIPTNKVQAKKQQKAGGTPGDPLKILQ